MLMHANAGKQLLWKNITILQGKKALHCRSKRYPGECNALENHPAIGIGFTRGISHTIGKKEKYHAFLFDLFNTR